MNKTLGIIGILVIIGVVGMVWYKKNNHTSILSGGTPVDLHLPVEVSPSASRASDGVYVVPVGATVGWAANKKMVPSWIDRGTVAATTGELSVTGGMPVSGTIVFDMNSIASTDTGGGSDTESTGRLANHLKAPDWFNAEKYPTAMFVLTRAVPAGDVDTSFRYTLTGRLTFKDITQEVTFDAYVYNEGVNSLRLQGAVDVDRTLWDIRFGSEKFFKDLGDKVINDIFVVNIDIQLPRKPEPVAEVVQQ